MVFLVQYTPNVKYTQVTKLSESKTFEKFPGSPLSVVKYTNASIDTTDQGMAGLLRLSYKNTNCINL